MSVHVLSDHPARQRRGARRNASRAEAPAPLTRGALIGDFLALCRLDPQVESLKAPSGLARFAIGGEAVEHVADFEVVRDGAAQLVDVLTDEDLARHPLRAAAVGGLQDEEGRSFLIETAMSVRAEPRFTTAKLILACRRTPVSAGDRVRILHALDEGGTLRLVECAGAAQNAVDGVAAVLALACEGLVAVDITRPILPETPVRRRKLACADPFEF